MSRRARNPRIEVRQALTILRTDLLVSLERWRGITRTVAIPAHERRVVGQTQRPRRPWEYPENNVTDWRVLAREIDHMREAFDDLATFVAAQLDRFHCTICEREIPGDEVRAGFTTCEHCPRPTRKAAS